MSDSMSPKVIFSQIIDPQRIELYWDEEVENAADPENFMLTRNRKKLHLVDDVKAEWNMLNVYEPNKKRTTLIVREPLSLADLGTVEIQLSVRIESQSHHQADPHSSIVVSNWHGRYTKFTKTRCGILIKSSDDVSYHTHTLAAAIIDLMLGKRSDIAAALVESNADVAVYGIHEDVYDIPEHRGGAQIMDRPVEGYGGMPTDTTTSISARNILRITDGIHRTRYPDESILAHEFGHAIHLLGIDLLQDRTLAQDLINAYKHARDAALWPRTYLMLNAEEYFATLTAMWFNVMAESHTGGWDGVRGPLNTRAELREYDPVGHSLLSRIYPDQNLPRPWDATPVHHSYAGHIQDVPRVAAI
ncbi:hypothetical protein Corgl_1565 [Coriobacterium glomerans PW2]|uniref:Uncharacterized protein n=1 Tax=Coriobacterium glomerans (strain ATCC 49209 / DSM 20642 / JCM 10262 / PW2) TaxID=700015 RepID=F2NAY6_CORGP|nr:hypothetical protein [Coriobacterium glomerans]AEB07664.1 hypothetical protein Corgl_1565 [Coriobacterium glomerans PW2]